MFAIYKREMRSYFITPLGYIYCAVFLFTSGGLFSLMTLKAGTNSAVGDYFQTMLVASALFIPLLTMKLLSEERKLRTEQLLLTSPVSLFGVIGAKYLAALTMFCGTFLLSCPQLLLLAKYGEVNWPKIFGNIIAIVLVGSAFTAIGIFVSSFTENQFVSAILSIVLILLLSIISVLNSVISSYVLRSVISWISVLDRYSYFIYGIFDVAAVVYYISITVIFLFLTVRIYEKRRWS